MTSEAQKRARDKWDAKHRKTVSAVIPIERYEVFRAKAEAEGLTPCGAVKKLINQYLDGD